jgi:hypothetical protein
MTPAPDHRSSAAVNALLALVVALTPLVGSGEPRAIDRREHRPWGCQTCPIPPAQPADEPVDPGL